MEKEYKILSSVSRGFAIAEIPSTSMHKRIVTQAPVADLYCLCAPFPLYT